MIFSYYYSKGIFWSRLFGFGFWIGNSKPLFSERNGIKKSIKLPFGYRMMFLGRGK